MQVKRLTVSFFFGLFATQLFVVLSNFLFFVFPSQTIAVVPVLPHGVVQLGSHLAVSSFSVFYT